MTGPAVEHDGTRVVVVGGGIAGLVAAVTARRSGAEVDLLEPHPLGGRARTDVRDGFTFNRGPRALYHGGAAERALAALGVDVATGGDPLPRRALALVDGRAHQLPVGPVATATTRLLSPGAKLTALRHLLPLLRDPGPIAPEITLQQHLDDRGTSGRTRGFLEAMVRVATYADAPDLLAAHDAFGQARRAATLGVRYLDGGFGSIVATLGELARDAGVVVRSTGSHGIGAEGDGWRVATDAGPIDADAVVLAVGGPRAAAALLDEAPAAWQRVGPPARAACLELGVRRVPAHRFVVGIDQPTYLSVHAPPADLAPAGGAVVHVARYRSADDDLDAASTRAQLRAVARAAGILDEDVATARYLDAMEVTGAIPVAAHGGIAGRPPVAVAGRPGLLVAGDWVGPEGMLLDAAVASAVEAGSLAAVRRATMARS